MGTFPHQDHRYPRFPAERGGGSDVQSVSENTEFTE